MILTLKRPLRKDALAQRITFLGSGAVSGEGVVAFYGVTAERAACKCSAKFIKYDYGRRAITILQQ